MNEQASMDFPFLRELMVGNKEMALKLFELESRIERKLEPRAEVC